MITYGGHLSAQESVDPVGPGMGDIKVRTDEEVVKNRWGDVIAKICEDCNENGICYVLQCKLD